MSSFLHKGKRQEVRKSKKIVKGHTQEVYKILAELDSLYKLVNEPEHEELRKQITSDNIAELLQPLTETELGKLEVFFLRGKFGFYEDMEEDIKEQRIDE